MSLNKKYNKGLKVLTATAVLGTLLTAGVTSNVLAYDPVSPEYMNQPGYDNPKKVLTYGGELVIPFQVENGDVIKVKMLTELTDKTITAKFSDKNIVFQNTQDGLIQEISNVYDGSGSKTFTLERTDETGGARMVYTVYVNDVLVFDGTNVTGGAGDKTVAKSGIEGSGFEVIAPSLVDFGVANISKETQIIDKTLGSVNVSDYTGLGNGWRLLVSASNFSDGVNVLPSNSLLLNVPESVSVAGDTVSVLPNILIETPVFIDNGNTITLANANVNEGMGSFDISFVEGKGLTAKIPPSTKIGNYESVITWQIVAGP